ncbi:MAG TPA: cytochrome c biogenesis protein CcsA [Candidatus Thermoplasmatota archaeon]|nr:cytochrome c biogenesis protein CcsA [Candidatus Thermoplasmatota archaeon]
MTLGAWTLGLAVAAAVAALLPWRHAALAARAHVALVLASLAWLTTDFLAGTLRHGYTWAHTHASYPLHYRLAGLWGGEEGTILLWNGVVALALLLLPRTKPLHLRAGAFLLLASGTLSFLALLLGTFEATTPSQLARAPLGAGLADVLLTPLMVIHPPIQFVAYGLLAVPAAYAVASLWEPRGDGAWAAHAYPWARRAWLFATAGLTLGALWAYYVLSFGGYWAWDPVETSNLLPWLALTAFLHAGKQRMRAQGNEMASLVLAYGALLLTLFATFATRSGLWVSVHAFTDPTDRFEPDAAARLLAILDVHLPTRAFLGILGALLLAGPGLYAARRLGQPLWGAALLVLAGAALLAPAESWGALFWLGSLATPLGVGVGILLALLVATPFVVAFVADDAEHPKPRADVRSLMAGAVILLSVAVGVAFLLNLQVVNGPDRSVFDTRAPFVAVPIVTVLTVMLALAPLGRPRALALAGAALAAGVGALLLTRSVLWLALPICGAATLAAVLKLAHVQGAAAPRRLRVAGALLLVASLLALVLWSNPPTRVGSMELSDGASLALGLAGAALATLGLLGSVAAFRARGRGVAVAGAFGATLALGYGVGSVLALAALALLWRERFADGFLAHERPRIRETGIYLIHLAVAIGLLGYAASTYAQERAVFTAVPLDAELGIGEYALALRPPQARVDGSALDALVVPVALSRGGADAGTEALSFEWRPASGVYAGVLDVRRTLAEDVYLAPMAFHTPDGWVGADSAAGARVAARSVDMVSFSVSVLPLMSLVWASSWMMVLGMGLVLVGSRKIG